MNDEVTFLLSIHMHERYKLFRGQAHTTVNSISSSHHKQFPVEHPSSSARTQAIRKQNEVANVFSASMYTGI